MTKRRLSHWIAALGLGLILVGAPALAATAPAPAQTPASATLGNARAAAPGDAHGRQPSYAQREAANPRAADFKGNGVGIYVGGSTLAVVLFVVLVVILL